MKVNQIQSDKTAFLAFRSKLSFCRAE